MVARKIPAVTRHCDVQHGLGGKVQWGLFRSINRSEKLNIKILLQSIGSTRLNMEENMNHRDSNTKNNQ